MLSRRAGNLIPASLRRLCHLPRNRQGGIAIWAAIVTPAFMVVAALSVDLSRMNALENDLQSAADSFARAAAYELDGRPDAISRANVAITRLVENEQRFGDDGRGNISVSGVRFFYSIPASDYDPITADYETDVPGDAVYAEVTVEPVRISTLFPVSLFNGQDQFDLTATSVAKTDPGICNAAPIFMCNPYENNPVQDLFDVAEDRSFRRRLVLMKDKGGPSAKYYPGNFGYLQADESGAAALKDAMAVTEPELCYSREGVELRTGTVASVEAGFNTRFDIYTGTYATKKNDPEYAPAPNVTKGYSGTACSPEVDPLAMGLPRDQCFLTDSCTDLGGRLGDGDWDATSYFAINHGSPTSAVIAGQTFTFNYSTGTVSPEKPTRYEVYNWEIETSRIPGTPSYVSSTTPENGAPQCYTGSTPADSNRRILKVAVLDCMRLEEEYGISGASAGDLPVKAFWKVFVTEPMPDGSDSTIWGELIGPVDASDEARIVEVARVVR
ncbi:pilus assembly protein TadG-related protein [Henriciella litoralis]|uniref:pilus assembly protein TadG-related protein n=1 Tax=Henriciella litoralis TaxID=568102 RepID=UPI000A04035F|nr:pilus assembly protein TadG-related protein [Henriciella litoralis]